MSDSFRKLKLRWDQKRQKRALRSKSFRDKLLKKGSPVFRKYNVNQVYIFGSVISGRCSKHSDIDLFVPSLPNDQYWQFRHELEEAVQLPIDLYTESDDPVFVRKIKERGEKIYGL